MGIPVTVTKGQRLFDGSTVGFSSDTGKPLADGETTTVDKSLLSFANADEPTATPTPTTPPVTPPVTPPTGTTDTTTPPATGRYARTANTNDPTIDADTAALEAAQGGPAPSLAAITAEKRQNAQAGIDAVSAEFNRQFGVQNTTNQTNDARTRAMNISNGLGGSDFATTNAVNTENKGKQAVDQINAQKTAQIQSILSDVDQRSSDEYQKEKQDYITGLGNNLALVKQAKADDQAKAIDSIKGLASQGVSIDTLQKEDPTSYNTLLQEYGGSEMDLQGVWNANLPANLQTTFTDKIVQGPNGSASLLRYGLDPISGTVTTKEYPLNASYNDLQGVKPVTVNGQLFALSTDKDGNQIARPLTAPKAASGSGTGKTVKSGKAVFSGDQMSQYQDTLKASEGTDHFVDPDVYQQAFDAWTDPSVGGLAKDFITQFPPKKYVNPANTTLPKYLQSGTGKAASGRSSQ